MLLRRNAISRSALPIVCVSAGVERRRNESNGATSGTKRATTAPTFVLGWNACSIASIRFSGLSASRAVLRTSKLSRQA